MKQPFLFKFIYWKYDPPIYILTYGEDEETAREVARQKLFYNSGDQAELKDVISCTHGF